MKLNKLLKFIKASQFFPVYAPGVTNWTHKMRGKDGRGQPIKFTAEDDAKIRSGLKDLADQAQFPVRAIGPF